MNFEQMNASQQFQECSQRLIGKIVPRQKKEKLAPVVIVQSAPQTSEVENMIGSLQTKLQENRERMQQLKELQEGASQKIQENEEKTSSYIRWLAKYQDKEDTDAAAAVYKDIGKLDQRRARLVREHRKYTEESCAVEKSEEEIKLKLDELKAC